MLGEKTPTRLTGKVPRAKINFGGNGVYQDLASSTVPADVSFRGETLATLAVEFHCTSESSHL